jgi:hypothetical protein
MYIVRNLNYANRKNPAWQRANNRARRQLDQLLLKEALKILPALLLCKTRQYHHLVSALIITMLFFWRNVARKQILPMLLLSPQKW